jgi:outer membrane protein OmpU
MKNLLIATTALVGTAGVAAADVNLSGFARFGVIYIDGAAPNETRIEHRFRLNIDATTESDNGLSFGARIRMQADDNNTGEFGGSTTPFLNGPRYFVSGSGLTVAAGNINGAIASMPNLFSGTIGLSGHTFANVVTNFNHDTYESTNPSRSGIEAIYSLGNLGVHVSHSDIGGIQRSAIAGSYNFSGWTVALGYQDSDTAGDTEWVATVGGTVGGANVALALADNDGDMKGVLSGSFEVSPGLTMIGFIASDEGEATEEAYGVGLNYDLGGGASFRTGLQSAHDTTTFDAGVLFNF